MSEMILKNIQFCLGMTFLWIGVTSLFGGKVKRIWLWILCYAGLLCLILISNMSIDFVAFLLAVASIMCYVLTVTFSSSHRHIKKICVLFILFYLQELFEMILENMFLLNPPDMEEQEWNTVKTAWSLFIMIVVSLGYLNKKPFVNNSKMKTYLRKSVIPLLVFVTFEVATLVVWLNISLEDSSNAKRYFWGSLLNTACMISIGIIVVIVIYIKNTNDKLEQMIVLEQQMKQLQANYYETLLDKEEATRKYRHDMNNHLICLKRLIEVGDMDGTKEYIGQMNANMQEIKNKSYNTGITIFDVLMNYHIEQLESEVDVKIKGCCNQSVALSDIDMCIVFSNLIQNAVEALNRSNREGEFFHVEIKEGKEFVGIKIVNSLLPETVQVDEKGNLQTVKKDKENHGIGILNVKETVEKNGGKIEYQLEKEQIVCEVILPIRSN